MNTTTTITTAAQREELTRDACRRRVPASKPPFPGVAESEIDSIIDELCDIAAGLGDEIEFECEENADSDTKDRELGYKLSQLAYDVLCERGERRKQIACWLT